MLRDKAFEKRKTFINKVVKSLKGVKIIDVEYDPQWDNIIFFTEFGDKINFKAHNSLEIYVTSLEDRIKDLEDALVQKNEDILKINAELSPLRTLGASLRLK